MLLHIWSLFVLLALPWLLRATARSSAAATCISSLGLEYVFYMSSRLNAIYAIASMLQRLLCAHA